MSAAAADAMQAVLAEISGGLNSWLSLRWLVENESVRDAPFDGAAGAHTRAACAEAAHKLIYSHSKVLKDVCNPSPNMNIYGKPLTQLELRRVDPRLSPYVDELMQETVRRLLGKRAGSGALEAKLHLHNHEQCTTWHKAATYLIGRIQSTPEQKPGREPDMSFIAGNATLAVLAEVGQSALTATIAATAPHWAMLRKALGKGSTTAATREAVDLTAAGNPLQYREEAAREHQEDVQLIGLDFEHVVFTWCFCGVFFVIQDTAKVLCYRVLFHYDVCGIKTDALANEERIAANERIQNGLSHSVTTNPKDILVGIEKQRLLHAGTVQSLSESGAQAVAPWSLSKALFGKKR
jgi:hypothetical protein